MKKRWVEKKQQEQQERKREIYEKIRKILERCLDANEIKMVMEDVEKIEGLGLCRLGVPVDRVWEKRKSEFGDDKEKMLKSSSELVDLMFDTKGFMYELAECSEEYSRYLDSEPFAFDGDIIITDPCYFIKDEDWAKSGYGEDVTPLGINHYMSRDTIYGDWSCTVFDPKTKKRIGEFCADAGMVAVADLGEVLRYNPGFDYHINRTWTTALIKDFKGSVQFVVKRSSYMFDGKKSWDYSVEVRGKGKNKITGEDIEFVGKQTGA